MRDQEKNHRSTDESKFFMSEIDIGRQLGLSRASVNKIIYRALNKLRVNSETIHYEEYLHDTKEKHRNTHC